MNFFLLTLLLLLWDRRCVGENRRSSSRIVSTKYGSLRGMEIQLGNRNLPKVEQYLGVPYASPPVGSLRFMPPVTPTHWKGVRVMDRFTSVCPQRLPDLRNETEALKRMPAGRLEYLKRLLPLLSNYSEDCLYLNVYVPYRSEGQGRLAVMVFIHGESYDWNAGNPYDGTMLAAYGNVLVVTINFRLGVFGFLPPLDTTSRANNGLMDIVAALHWVQENIAEFGGDKNNVTLMGHGTGAACVHLLMLSPVGKNLFHRGILHSGSALSSWAIARNAKRYARELATTFDCPLADNNIFLNCMRDLSVAQILKAPLTVPDHLAAFGPTVDGILVPKDPVLLMEDEESRFGNYDLMFGVTRVESPYLRMGADEDRHGFDQEKRDRILRTLVRNTNTFHLQEIFLTIVNEYTDWTKPVQHPFNVLDSATDALSDALVVAPAVRTGNYHAPAQTKTYFYLFSHQTESGYYTPRMGCLHGEDLPYLFGAPLYAGSAHFARNYTRSEITLSEQVMTLWTNFAKTGEPTGSPVEGETSSEDKGKGRSDKISWPPYDAVQQKYLMIGVKSKVRDHYNAHRLSFWLHLIPHLDQSRGIAIDLQHHQLDDHDNPLKYDGVVRPHSLRLDDDLASTSSTTEAFPPGAAMQVPTRALPPNGTLPPSPTSGPPSEATAGSAASSSADSNGTNSLAVVLPPNGYSTALSVTIAVGCSLLILNVLIFAGVYYQRDKKGEEAAHREACKQTMPGSSPMDCQYGMGMVGKHQFIRLPTTGAGMPPGLSPADYMDHHNAVVPSVIGILPPKIPPKPNALNSPPQELHLPEAQPLLGQDPAATLTRGRSPAQEMRILRAPLVECPARTPAFVRSQRLWGEARLAQGCSDECTLSRMGSTETPPPQLDEPQPFTTSSTTTTNCTTVVVVTAECPPQTQNHCHQVSKANPNKPCVQKETTV